MPAANDNGQNKAMAVIAYLGILFLVPLLAAKDSQFAQFHAKQGMILFLAEIALSIVGMIPFLGWLVWGFGSLLVFILFIIGIANALSGKEQPLPLIGGFADKFNL